MPIALTVAAAVLAGVGVWLRSSSQDRARAASYGRTTETSRAADLNAWVAEVAADLPPGPSGQLASASATGLHRFAELSGTLRCDTPLTGALSGEAAAVVQTRVLRKIETRRWREDSNGRRTSHWETSHETVSGIRREEPFYLDDGAGRVRGLAPDADDLPLVEAVDRFEPESAVQRHSDRMTLALGPVSFDLGHALSGC